MENEQILNEFYTAFFAANAINHAKNKIHNNRTDEKDDVEFLRNFCNEIIENYGDLVSYVKPSDSDFESKILCLSGKNCRIFLYKTSDNKFNTLCCFTYDSCVGSTHCAEINPDSKFFNNQDASERSHLINKMMDYTINAPSITTANKHYGRIINCINNTKQLKILNNPSFFNSDED